MISPIYLKFGNSYNSLPALSCSSFIRNVNDLMPYPAKIVVSSLLK